MTVDALDLATSRVRVRVRQDSRIVFDVPELGRRTTALHVPAGSALVAFCIGRIGGNVARFVTTTPLTVEAEDEVTHYRWDGVSTFGARWTADEDLAFWRVAMEGIGIREVAL